MDGVNATMASPSPHSTVHNAKRDIEQCQMQRERTLNKKTTAPPAAAKRMAGTVTFCPDVNDLAKQMSSLSLHAEASDKSADLPNIMTGCTGAGVIIQVSSRLVRSLSQKLEPSAKTRNSSVCQGCSRLGRKGPALVELAVSIGKPSMPGSASKL